MNKISMISFLIFFLCSCAEYKVASNVNVNDIKYQYEELYLDEIDLNIDKDKNIQIDQENWKRINSNLIKIHYHILKIQSQLDEK